jgi:hypothetical protein
MKSSATTKHIAETEISISNRLYPVSALSSLYLEFMRLVLF